MLPGCLLPNCLLPNCRGLGIFRVEGGRSRLHRPLAEQTAEAHRKSGHTHHQRFQLFPANRQEVNFGLGVGALPLQLIGKYRSLAENVPCAQHPTVAARKGLHSDVAPLHQIEHIAGRTGPENLLASPEAGGVQTVHHCFEIVAAQIGKQGEAAVVAFVHRILLGRKPGSHHLIERRTDGGIQPHQFVQIGLVEYPQIGVAGGRSVVNPVLASEQTHLAKETACGNPIDLLHNAVGVLGCDLGFARVHQIERIPGLAGPIDRLARRHVVQHQPLGNGL